MSVGHTLTMEYIECSSEGKKKKKKRLSQKGLQGHEYIMKFTSHQ